MNRETARQEVRAKWRFFYRPDRKNKGIECPLCGSGSGDKGTGITENPKKPGQLRCWNCGFQGDIIDLIMQDHNLDYNAALKEAAAELNLTIDPYRTSAEEDFADAATRGAQEAPQSDFNGIDDIKQDGDIETPQRAAQRPAGASVKNYTDYYARCGQNLSNPAAISYLQARGISPETAAAYGIGYDPAWISPTVIRNQQAKGSEWRPPATQRIIMPVTSSHYVARAIDPELKEYAKMNETGNGKIGIFNTGAVYEGTGAVFVTEGIFDALSIIETGAAAVALNSTSNAEAFIKMLEAEPTQATLVLCMDNDEPGKRAAAELKQGLTRLNISYITADICGGYKDPNAALTGNREAFIKAIRDTEAQAAAKPDNVRAYIDDLMQGEIERLKAAADRKTGFVELDSKSGGLYPGLYVLAATSSLGKTTFALQIADNLAAAGHDVLFFSMEQSRLELVSKSFARILAQKQDGTEVSSLALRKGLYPDKLTEAAAIYKEKIADSMSIIEGNFNCNITLIGEYIRRYIRQNGTSPIVFIDYLQILRPAEDQKTTSTKETVDATVTELKRISREHDLTVFVVSSVNRANYMTPIDFEALKESGGIEYTADVIWGLQLDCLNDDLFDKQNKIKEKRQRIREAKAANPRKIELLCLKNRYGIANFSCSFDYYPGKDLFAQVTRDFAPDYGRSPFTSSGTVGAGKGVTASF